ncbi:tyrosine-type recombinase/integrase [Intrasporangium flavum]|uniref:tyrosine-type recombinase/integrase n=1 Tax=Intrasporangium flavum TaxID=1428657 RepID=UPI001A961A6E|nr:site-specific integrase [Intrasporangium flavum]
MRAGTYVAESAVTFEQHARTWLGRQLQHEPGTAETAERRLRLDAYDAFGHKPLQRITKGDVQDMVAALARRGLAPATIALSFVYVRAVFNAALDERLIVVSPCKGVRLPKADHKLIAPMTVEQVMTVGERAPAHLRRAAVFAAGTGMRPGEWRSITLDRVKPGKVHLDRQLAPGTSASKVVWGPLKTKASYRWVSLSPSIEKVLLEQIEMGTRGPEGLVFSGLRGAPLRRQQLQYAWDKATAGMDLPDRSGWHDLRHFHASLLIAQGASPRAVADRLGHKDPSETLATYSHLWPSDEGRIWAAVEGVFGLSDGPETDQPR